MTTLPIIDRHMPPAPTDHVTASASHSSGSSPGPVLEDERRVWFPGLDDRPSIVVVVLTALQYESDHAARLEHFDDPLNTCSAGLELARAVALPERDHDSFDWKVR